MKFVSAHKASTVVFVAVFLFCTFIVISSLPPETSFFLYLLPILIMSTIVSLPFFLIEVVYHKYLKNKKVENKKAVTPILETEDPLPQKMKTSVENDEALHFEKSKPIEPLQAVEIDTKEQIHKKENLVNKNTFYAIDFETATDKTNSACSIGIVTVTDEEIVLKEHFLIKPPNNEYNKRNISIHGITPQDTEKYELFPSIWDKIKHYFDNTFIIAHNAAFDMGVLKSTLSFYNLTFPTFKYLDSMVIGARYADKDILESRKLPDLCKYYNIPLDNHHNAESDAIACASIVICAINNSRFKNFTSFIKSRNFVKDFSEVKTRESNSFKKDLHHHIRIADIIESVLEDSKVLDEDFCGKNFAFTGEIDDISREEAYERVIAGGGTVKSSVSKKVDFLVNADTVMTGKLKAALELQQNGHHIQIITGEQFMDMLESTEAINL